jgi:hypothetical protein
MYQSWNKSGKSGNVLFPRGEVVYQTKGIVIEPIYEDFNGTRYIEDNGRLLSVTTNPFNGYCYRQDGL